MPCAAPMRHRSAGRGGKLLGAAEARADALRVDLASQADGTTLGIEAARLRGELQDTQEAAQQSQEWLAAMQRAEPSGRRGGLLGAAQARDAGGARLAASNSCAAPCSRRHWQTESRLPKAECGVRLSEPSVNPITSFGLGAA